MKVRGDTKPELAFTVEAIPNHPGWVLARFYEHAVQTDPGWEYDEYRLKLRNTGNVSADIEGNFDVYFQEAKRQDMEANPPNIEQMRADLDYIAALGGVEL